jgi:ABC-type multidrug transport system fused ATPase/permease subunit
MVLALDSLWFAVLIMTLVVICTAFYLSAPVFWALLILIIAIGLTLTIISTINKRRQARQDASDEGMLLEYLHSHGLGGNLSELSVNLSMSEEKTQRLLRLLEEHGAIPEGSAHSFRAKPQDVSRN